MADWRTRNFVPDSDEEDEILGSLQSSQGNGTDANSEAFLDIDDVFATTNRVQKDTEDAARAGATSSRAKTQKDAGHDATAAKTSPRVVIVVNREESSDEEDELALPAPRAHSENLSAKRSLNALFSESTDPIEAAQDGQNKSLESQGRLASDRPLRSEDDRPPDVQPVNDAPGSPSASSTLSSLSSSASELLDFNPPIHRDGNANSDMDRQDVTAHSPIAEAENNTMSSRRFRNRNPIQMNPYAIEAQRYKTSMKSRGMMPVHVLQQEDAEQSQSADENEDCSAQEWSSEEEERTDWNSSLLVSTQQPPVAYSSQLGEEIDLPDVEALFERRLDIGVQYGTKRRKTKHANALHNHQKQPGNAPSSSIDRPASLPTNDSRSVDLQSAPSLPTPPTTGKARPSSSDSHHVTVKFRFPFSVEATQPQTPETSSEHGASDDSEHPTTFENKVGPTVGQSLASTNKVSVSGSEVESGPESREQPDSEPELVIAKKEPEAADALSKQLRRMQRKIKGVLPASWLRLDRKMQEEKRDTEDQRLIPGARGSEETRSSRGPYAPRSKARSLPGSSSCSREEPLLISDGSPEPVVVAYARKPSLKKTPRGPKQSVLQRIEDLEDCFEEDDVDMMLPTKSRSSKGRRARGKYRQKTLGFRQESTIANKDQAVDSGRNRAQNTAHVTEDKHLHPKAREAKQQKRKTALSLLDTLSPESLESAPQFLRVAARSTKKRGDRGVQSPTHKFIRLPLKDDTQSAFQLLEDWRDGSLKRRNPPKNKSLAARSSTVKTSIARSTREPLKDLPSNVQRIYHDKISEAPKLNRTHLEEQAPTRNIVNKGNQSDTRILENSKPTSPVQNPVGKWIRTTRKGQISSNMGGKANLAPAVLETHRSAKGSHHRYRSVGGPLLPKFVSNLSAATTVGFRNEGSTSRRVSIEGPAGQNALLPKAKRLRKQIPHRNEPDLSVPDQFVDVSNGHEGFNASQQAEASVTELPKCTSFISNLHLSSATYSTDFGIQPLPDGICFDRSSIIGSGEFACSLSLTDFGQRSNPLTFTFEGEIWEWAAWNEVISSQLTTIFGRIGQLLSGNAAGENRCTELIEALMMIVRYLNHHLRFSDPIDRQSFVARCTQLISLHVDMINDQTIQGTAGSITGRTLKFNVTCSFVFLILSNQLFRIADHHVVTDDTKDATRVILEKGIRQTLCMAFIEGTEDVRLFCRQVTAMSAVTLSSRNLASCKAEAIVVTLHIIETWRTILPPFWTCLSHNTKLFSPAPKEDARALECSWQNLFTILPLLDVDDGGHVDRIRRSNRQRQGWNVVLDLMKPVLEAYERKPEEQDARFSSYCRVILARCFGLLQRWSWIHCESVISRIFDFFGRNSFKHLTHEECHESPKFLSALTDHLVLYQGPEDRCFHLFLKILGTGLRKARLVYPEKKIRDMLFRLTPNHGRQLPKDEAVRQEDLDSLRNHHDLLSVLYWSAPSKFRLRLESIQQLVCLEDSHRAACQTSIRTWSHLVTFQLSTSESSAALAPFGVWCEDIVKQVVHQHQLARTEVEAHVRSANRSSDPIPRDLQERTIAANQRQAEATLCDALALLKVAISRSQTVEAAQTLLTPSIAKVFRLLDPKQPRTNTMVTEAAQVVLAFIERTRALQSTEDSQGFGDLLGFEELDADTPGPMVSDALQTEIQDLLSRVVGTEDRFGDELVEEIIRMWLAVASTEVKAERRSWTDYVGPYGPRSWSMLSNTDHVRKFTPLVLASMLDLDNTLYEQQKPLMLKGWIEAMVERESALKFQHVLTETILNLDSSSSLFNNPPLVRDRDGKYRMTFNDLRERRTMLLACYLANVQESLAFTAYKGLQAESRLRRECVDILRHLMGAMRRNYGESGAEAGSGTYVAFIQQVVELLQHYSAEICPIDRFFTDASTFPLPSHDPSYVVGRLRNYGQRLSDQHIPKQLASFVQSVSERAAMDGQQDYLTKQLRSAMSCDADNGGALTSLRTYLVRGIFPAYIDAVFSTDTGWIAAMPILEALEPTVDDMLYDLDGCDDQSMQDLQLTVFGLLSRLRQSSRPVSCGRYLEVPSSIRAVACYFAIATAAIRPLDYAARLGFGQRSALGVVRYFVGLAATVACRVTRVLGRDESAAAPEPLLDVIETAGSKKLEAVRSFAIQALKTSLHSTWSRDGGRYFLAHGGLISEVPTRLRSLSDEQSALLTQINRFVQAVDSSPSFSDVLSGGDDDGKDDNDQT